MVPDLVCLEIFDGQFVHETEFYIKRSFDSQEGLVSILPVKSATIVSPAENPQNSKYTKQYNEPGFVE